MQCSTAYSPIRATVTLRTCPGIPVLLRSWLCPCTAQTRYYPRPERGVFQSPGFRISRKWKVLQRYPPDRHTPPSSARHSSGGRGPNYSPCRRTPHLRPCLSPYTAFLPPPRSHPIPARPPRHQATPPFALTSRFRTFSCARGSRAQRRGVSHHHVSRNTSVGSRAIQTADGRYRARVGGYTCRRGATRSVRPSSRRG